MHPDDIELKLRQIITKVTKEKIDNVTSSDDLRNTLGFDSLTALRILAKIEKCFDLRFPNEKLSNLKSIHDLINAIQINKGLSQKD